MQLHLLQAVLVPVLQYGCQVWGMHSPSVAAANRARLDLQRLYDYYYEKHLVFECAALASLPSRRARSRYASLFTSSTDTMSSIFAQPDHIGVFHYVVDCPDFMKI